MSALTREQIEEIRRYFEKWDEAKLAIAIHSANCEDMMELCDMALASLGTAAIAAVREAQAGEPISASRAAQLLVAAVPYGYVWHDKNMERRFNHVLPKEGVIGDAVPVYRAPQSTQQIDARRENVIRECWDAIDAKIQRGEIPEPQHERRNGMVLAANILSEMMGWPKARYAEELSDGKQE